MKTHVATPSSQGQGQASVCWQPRRIPLSHDERTCGRLPIRPEVYSIEYESGLERRAIAFLLSEPGLRFLQSQPFTLRYDSAGASRRYTPDFLVVYSPLGRAFRRMGFGMWTVVEVKDHGRFERHSAEILERLHQVALATGMATVCLTDHQLH